MYLTYNTTSIYAGDIILDANSIVTFGAASNGRVIMNGAIAQEINTIGVTPTPRFRNLQTLNSTDEITLNTPIEIISELDLNQGNINTTMINMLL